MLVWENADEPEGGEREGAVLGWEEEDLEGRGGNGALRDGGVRLTHGGGIWRRGDSGLAGGDKLPGN